MSLSILIADDEPNQLELLAFNSEGRYVVHKAHDGQSVDMISNYVLIWSFWIG